MKKTRNRLELIDEIPVVFKQVCLWIRLDISRGLSDFELLKAYGESIGLFDGCKDFLRGASLSDDLEKQQIFLEKLSARSFKPRPDEPDYNPSRKLKLLNLGIEAPLPK